MNSKDPTLIQFGSKVRLARKELSMSQEQLASIANMHRTYIGMIERGEKNITLTNILKLSQALSISASTLLESIK